MDLQKLVNDGMNMFYSINRPWFGPTQVRSENEICVGARYQIVHLPDPEVKSCGFEIAIRISRVSTPGRHGSSRLWFYHRINDDGTMTDNFDFELILDSLSIAPEPNGKWYTHSFLKKPLKLVSKS